MGILNVTPDSFSDGGRWLEPDRAVARGLEMIDEGADIVDVGGESTRPGASAVPAEEELRRVLPVVEALSPHVRVSIDTSKASVAEAAVGAGATLVNDVSASLWPVAARVRGGLGGDAPAGHPDHHAGGPPLRRRGGRGPGPAGRPGRPGGRRRGARDLDRPGHRVRQDRGPQPRAAGRPRRAGGHRLPGPGGDQSQGLPRGRSAPAPTACRCRPTSVSRVRWPPPRMRSTGGRVWSGCTMWPPRCRPRSWSAGWPRDPGAQDRCWRRRSDREGQVGSRASRRGTSPGSSRTGWR